MTVDLLKCRAAPTRNDNTNVCFVQCCASVTALRSAHVPDRHRLSFAAVYRVGGRLSALETQDKSSRLAIPHPTLPKNYIKYAAVGLNIGISEGNRYISASGRSIFNIDIIWEPLEQALEKRRTYLHTAHSTRRRRHLRSRRNRDNITGKLQTDLLFSPEMFVSHLPL